MKKVFITQKIPSKAKSLLKEKGYKVSVYSKNEPLTKSEFLRLAKSVDAVISTLSVKIDKEVIDQLNRCKIFANYAVGYNNIDVEYANSKGIIVTNTPDVLTDATSEIAVALILSCSRRITEAERFMRDKKFKGWQPELLLGYQLSGKTVGIIGAGRIGQATAVRMKSFGCKIVYFSKTKKSHFEKEVGARKVRFNRLMQISDIVSLHLPLNSGTKNIVDKEKLELLKPSAIVVNTARGEVIDEKYLIKMLKKKRIFAAGFDVYENEPNVNKDLYMLKNVVLLPHIGSGSIETRDKMAELAAKNVINVLNNISALTPVS